MKRVKNILDTMTAIIFVLFFPILFWMIWGDGWVLQAKVLFSMVVLFVAINIAAYIIEKLMDELKNLK